jgi:hypothetical protein
MPLPILALAATVLASAGESTRIQQAVSFATASGRFVQLDIAPLPDGWAPAIDSVSVVSNTARVSWHLAASDTASGAPRANVMVPIPEGNLPVDSVEDRTRGQFLAVSGQVRNPEAIYCLMVKCGVVDSATAFAAAVERLKSSSLVATFSPRVIYYESFVAVSPWKSASGTESISSVVQPLAGNAGNWIDLETVTLGADSFVVGNPNICSGPSICTKMYRLVEADIPVGPVSYWYQQATDPFRGDTADLGRSYVVDSILKMGPSLHLSGTWRQQCYAPAVDSSLYTETQWLVASNGDGADSIVAAFRAGSLCSGTRLGAWPVRDGKVVISGTYAVPLEDLLGAAFPSAFAAPRSTDRGIGLHRSGNVLELELARSTEVRIVDLRGAEIAPSRILPAGTSRLLLPTRHGTTFLMLRQGASTVTLPLDPVR